MNYVERKYLLMLSSKLDRFKEVGNDVFNFRCPFCNDSEKNKFKARGYLFPHKNNPTFKCHNCGRIHSFSSFLQQIDPNLYGQFKVENFGSKHLKKKIDIKGDDVRNRFQENKKSSPLKNCIALSDLTCDHPLYLVKEYAIGRKIPAKFFPHLYAAPSLVSISLEIDKLKDKKFPLFPILVIPFFTWDGKFDYIQCRSTTGRKDFRFTTFEVEADGLKVWGIPWIDWTKPIHVFEGPIDAMFVDNSIAVGGASDTGLIQWLLTKKRKSEIIFCFDNDYKKNPDILKLVEKRVTDGFNVLLYDKEFKWKDINDAAKKGHWSIDTINNYVEKRTFIDLRAKLELSQVKKHK